MKSLVRRRFGRLKVVAFAGFQEGVSHPYWCCLCECGNTCRVEGRALLGKGKNLQVSCGCSRADSEVRRLARLKVPPKKRAAICRKMRKAVTRHTPAYSLDAKGAAEILGISEEQVQILCKDGVLGSRLKGDALRVSSEDVGTLIRTQKRNRKRCDLELAGIAKASAKRMPWPEEYFHVNPLEQARGVTSTDTLQFSHRRKQDQDPDRDSGFG
jgi:hypothetical protein